MFTTSPRADGLTLLVPINSLYLDQIVGRKEVKFDVRKFEFIGTQEKAPTMLYFRADSPFKTLDDIIQAKEAAEMRLHGHGEHRLLARRNLWTRLSKRKLNTVTGYQGGSEIDVAVERGEIVCRGMDIPPHFGREPFDSWHKKGFDRHILQGGPKRDPRMGDAPTLFELMDQFKTPERDARASRGSLWQAAILADPCSLARQSAGSDKNNARSLRQGDARPRLDRRSQKKANGHGAHPGEDLQTLMKELMNQPRDVIDRVKKVLAE